MTLAAQPLVELDDSYARDLPELVLARAAAPARGPALVELNEPLAAELGLDPAALRGDDGVALLVGTGVPEGVTPVALVYSGHQFGMYAPRLGDGRALLLGELHDAEGHRRDLHLKGSGRTPFARGGDGKAALGPMLREYVVSEAMHALGIPTTRSLAVSRTGETIMREDGPKQGAVLARVAASHIRVGTFQYAAAQGGPELVRRLADHAIARHHPSAAGSDNPYLALLEAVADAQASLIARWMLVGFVHGVMNTDNMTISGETIDYGPCAFLDAFDPSAVFSSIDEGGRYSYRNQPRVAQWNLARLGECLLPLIDDDTDRAVEAATAVLDGFNERYSAAWSAGMRTKLGLPGDDDGDGDGLVGDLAILLAENKVDYTSFFRALSSAAAGDPEPARSLVTDLPAIDAWLQRWRSRVTATPAELDAVNPVYVPRNHKVEEALAAAENGDLAPFRTLVDVVTHPFQARPGLEDHAVGDPTASPYVTYCGT